MTFTSMLSSIWTLIGTFMSGTNFYMSAYSKVGETVDARAEIFRDDQLAQLHEQSITNAKRLKELAQ